MVLPRLLGVQGAAVPKATIYKYCYHEMGEDKIRLSEGGVTAAPAGNVILAEYSDESEFRLFVTVTSDP